jgi:transposase
MDMSPSFIAGAAEHFRAATVVFDHFHIMQMAGKAVDEVRAALCRAGADLRGGLWALRGNAANRSAQQVDTRARLIRDYPMLGRALALRECLQLALKSDNPQDLEGFCRWADRSRSCPSGNSPPRSRPTVRASWFLCGHA